LPLRLGTKSIRASPMA